ncbi:MAG: hypothetical protein FJX35_25125 [Alphaproteobacteria bacterium]|nr:hypothetical protein [Alphaproteobacteria bacterium]
MPRNGPIPISPRAGGHRVRDLSDGLLDTDRDRLRFEPGTFDTNPRAPGRNRDGDYTYVGPSVRQSGHGEQHGTTDGTCAVQIIGGHSVELTHHDWPF